MRVSDARVPTPETTPRLGFGGRTARCARPRTRSSVRFQQEPAATTDMLMHTDHRALAHAVSKE